MNPVFLIAFAVATQESQTESLTLSELFRDVEANSLALVGERAAVEAAQRRADAAGAWSDPFVAFGPDEYTFDASPPMLRFEVSQAIPLPGTLSPGVNAAKANARAAQAGVDVTLRGLRVAALDMFLRGLHASRTVAALKTQQQLLDDIIASAQARYAAGGSGQRDVLLASAEKAELEQQALVQERELMMIVARLDELRGLTPRARILTFVDDRADAARPVPKTLDELLETQPELLRARAALDAADARADGAATNMLPDIVVQGMWMQSLRADEPSTAGAMVGLSVPLFYWWKQGPEADAAARERNVVDAERARLLLALTAQWEQASLRLKTAHDRVALYREKIVPATTAAVGSTRAAYAAQSAQLVEVLSLMRREVSVDLALHDAELEVRQAEQALRDLLTTGAGSSLASGGVMSSSPTMSSSPGAMPSAPRRARQMNDERPGASPPPGTMMMREMSGM